MLTDLGQGSTVVDGVALALDDGREMGLDNLARTLSRLPRKRWARAVRDQLSALIRIDPTQPVASADLRAKLWPRERADAFLTYEPMEPLPGVVAVLAARGDGVSHEFGRLDTVGDRDEAYDAALTNLAGLALPRWVRRRADPRLPTSWIEFLESADSYGAARVLVLPDLLRRGLGTDFPARGVLVAVPTKFELWVHVPVDEQVASTAITMAQLAHETWASEPYPVSPDVFLVSPHTHAVRVVQPDRTGCSIDRRAMLRLMASLVDPERGREAS